MIKPLNDRVLIKPKTAMEEKTAGGIYIPDTVRDENVKEGEVVEVGKLKDIQLNMGDRVIYEAHAGTELKINNKTYVIVKEEDIIAKIE